MLVCLSFNGRMGISPPGGGGGGGGGAPLEEEEEEEEGGGGGGGGVLEGAWTAGLLILTDFLACFVALFICFIKNSAVSGFWSSSWLTPAFSKIFLHSEGTERKIDLS